MARTVSEGLIHLIRISGIGGMKPNTICLGFYDDTTPTDGLMKTRVRYRRFFGAVENGNSQELENNFGDIRMDTDDRMISAPGEYVSFIRDTLKLMKNVSLCRHFSQLDKRAIFNSKNDQYIDVWPLNFFQPETSNYFDNTCLYLLQLACIQHMVPSWKRCTKLRVFLCVDTQNDNTLEKEEKLDDFLRQLRILARIKIVTWDDILAQYRSTGPHPESLEETMHEFDSLDDGTLDMINKLILSHSNSTVTTFLYLPSPPKDIQLYPEYLRQLTTLSDGLPPTMYVHGLHPVTSTTLWLILFFLLSIKFILKTKSFFLFFFILKMERSPFRKMMDSFKKERKKKYKPHLLSNTHAYSHAHTHTSISWKIKTDFNKRKILNQANGF